MGKIILKFWPLLFILIFTAVFFNQLFFPISIFSTPGDIAYFNYPLKNFLAESLKNHQLPLWTNLIGTGFPILADSPIGAFYLPNMILFYLFPTPIAFNLHYIFIFLTSTIGTYLLCKNFRFSNTASLYAGLAYGYSGFFIARIIHTSFIQSASLLPFIFLLVDKYYEKKDKRHLLIFSLLICQLVFTGYPQALLYSLFTIYCYIFVKYYLLAKVRKHFFLSFGLVFLSIVIGFVLASAQILPTLEMLNASTRSSGLGSGELFRNSGSIKILALFFNPFFFGDISKGTFNASEIGYYWENIAYSGLLTPILAIFSVFFVRKNKMIVFTFSFIALLSLMLALGKFGPAHVIFDIPPFSFFRIPARFLFITSFSIAILAAISINLLKNNKLTSLLGFLLVVIITVDIFIYWHNFNTYTNEKVYLEYPESVKYLKNISSNNSRISTLWPYLQKSSKAKDWDESLNQNLWDFNLLNADINMVYHIPSSDFYTSFSTRRLDLMRQLLRLNIKVENENEAKITDTGINLLKLQAVEFLITPFNVIAKDAVEIKTFDNPGNEQIHIYKIDNNVTRFRVLKNYEVVSNLKELTDKLQDKNLNANDTVILEKEPPKIEKRLKNTIVEDVSENGNNISLKISSDGQGFLVISDTYFQGWGAYINDKKTEVLPANGNSKAIFLNEGNNHVKISYQPNSVKIGLLVTILGHVLVFALLFMPQKLFKDLSSRLLRK